jgi:hypothetical protein
LIDTVVLPDDDATSWNVAGTDVTSIAPEQAKSFFVFPASHTF